MLESISQLPIWKILAKVNDGVLEVTLAIRVVTVPRGFVVEHIIRFPREKEKLNVVCSVSR